MDFWNYMDALIRSSQYHRRPVQTRCRNQLLLGCNETEKQLALNASTGDTMRAEIVRRP